MPKFIAAIDQGTTSTRCIIFDHGGRPRGSHQLEHQQLLPRAGWVEHDPVEIWERTRTVIQRALSAAGAASTDVAAIGITNQRETTIVWNPRTGEPYHPAIVWQDTRSDRIVRAVEQAGSGDVIRTKSGLLPAPYFSGGKLRWLLDNVEGLQEAAEGGDAIFGTPDTWLLWNLTGGVDGGVHITDVTNASRTMLMGLSTMEWDDELLEIFGVPRRMLPQIRASSDPDFYGTTRAEGPFRAAVPVAGILGDQQAATVGQACFAQGMAKNTYGTGNFCVLNTGSEPTTSTHGLLTIPAYQFDQTTAFGLEGSIAVTGSAVQWLRDQLGVIGNAAETEALATSVDDTGGVYFVPAFSGLYAPHWRSDARGAIVGLSRFSNRAHLARATLESICYQTLDVVDAMVADSGIELELLRVDGGATVNDLLMQLQADILGVPVSRPVVTETTALGAAYAAGLAVGYWTDTDELTANWAEERQFAPQWSADRRESGHADWKRAVERTLDWVQP